MAKDRLSLAHKVAAQALSTFDKVVADLKSANAHLDSVIDEAHAAIAHHQSRADEAAQAAVRNSSVIQKIEALVR